MTDTAVLPPETDTAARPGARGTGLAVLFACTTFLGAALLFMIQPLAARLILPSFGGSATVWSTSSLFFQVLLLAGYVYAHVATRRLGARWQPRAHVLVLVAPLLVLPLALPSDAAPGADASPVLWLLRTLAVMVGLPYLVLSATGPLIQRWYAWSGGPRAEDPYFLFAASNLGSFIGLLAYPFVVEPLLSLSEQRVVWSGAFVVWVVLMGVCGLTVRRDASRDASSSQAGSPDAAVVAEDVAPPTRRTLAWWTAMAFLPSSLMLAVTAHLSTDVAPIPLLWVLPLAAYLATFVAAFARTSRTVPLRATHAAVAAAFVCAVLSLVTHDVPVLVSVGASIVATTLVGYAAHARLAATRPAPQHLTLFYLVISAGGALGGLLNGVVAPLAFNRVWEYGLTLAAVPLLLVGVSPRAGNWFTRRYDARFVAVMLTLGLALALIPAAVLVRGANDVSSWLVIAALVPLLAFGYVAGRAPRPLAASLAIAALLLGVQATASSLILERTFYGSYRVVETDDTHILVHGTTNHGVQFTAPDRRSQPTAYYVESGPLGAILGSVPHTRMGVVGLGSGVITPYAEPGDEVTYYEIDPAVVDIASDPELFTFLRDSEAQVDVVVGDGRLLLEQETETFDVLLLDAFSSDAIPVHLLTREAVRTYLDRLAPDGVIAIHISNRVFELEPVLAAAAAHHGLRGAIGDGGSGPASARSRWVVLSKNDAVVDELQVLPDWRALDMDRQVAWTDDYSSVLSVLK